MQILWYFFASEQKVARNLLKPKTKYCL